MKKFIAILLIGLLAFSLISCGDEEAETSETAETTSSVTVDAASKFTDVNRGDWFEESTSWAVSEDIVEEAKPTQFGSNTPVSKREVILALWKAAGAPGQVVSAKTVPDDDPDSDINKAIDWAISKEIVKLESDADSSDISSRLDTIEFIYKEAGSPVAAGYNEFVDAKGIDSVNWAREEGITLGTGGNNFSPELDTTKAMLVTFLFRAK